jgi:hypothetical protein
MARFRNCVVHYRWSASGSLRHTAEAAAADDDDFGTCESSLGHVAPSGRAPHHRRTSLAQVVQFGTLPFRLQPVRREHR